MKAIKNSNKDFLLQIGQKIRFSREQKGWSQETLSFNSQLHRTYIGAVERGERNISILNLKKIAEALGVQITDLLPQQEKSRKEKNNNAD
ncbi:MULTISPECIES: helix-turn-helix domain-containing protein [Brevibacillus]|uniref:helix-turn-helix domain-containing protein n=1 Tax=Brevibacillus TaxID=55080 RepID=UPI0002A4F27F|nr:MULTISPECIES: helix-turn-helix transcriptional regulator [Brevibacillus]ELK41520.1 helix-turn-helix domain protein [Brevibacillus agri BAB-2500]MCG5252270.1 helix-turn-helix domain-containing protein [Brevibacillus agri]MDN4095315.1 helix-turn-helix transcriptional regulator [Brevibacillus agri]MDR9505404.1 helix-turn-helix transcriptional regulator [Brevibacillus agri]MED3500654.1 helix-turn-helix transcriptional regulator [Brevibacillus agri]